MSISRGEICECLKCGYAWEARFDKLPKECPDCKSRKWGRNDERMRRGDRESKETSPGMVRDGERVPISTMRVFGTGGNRRNHEEERN